ncbi:hypothetical protein BFP77_11785 [Maribacter sp. 4U21]|uniref:iron chaperone n=1 Tax=Maribacter sp. 4U21 TaxID=1889779 RepID=UPI000C155B2B|nr:DUF1801 domain-containing protein [Maribacter sp. 4U21]PIB27564.1 hypothetical protein BFP77_11785 [Maribacter sp. 4U21]
MENVSTVNEYILKFSGEAQERLKLMRKIVRENAPDAVESISYGMPAYKLNKKPLVYFGGYQSHIGFYATPSGHAKFKEELSPYKQGKGSVQFPFDKTLPVDLITEMVRFRVAENSV